MTFSEGLQEAKDFAINFYSENKQKEIELAKKAIKEGRSPLKHITLAKVYRDGEGLSYSFPETPFKMIKMMVTPFTGSISPLNAVLFVGDVADNVHQGETRRQKDPRQNPNCRPTRYRPPMGTRRASSTKSYNRNVQIHEKNIRRDSARKVNRTHGNLRRTYSSRDVLDRYSATTSENTFSRLGSLLKSQDPMTASSLYRGMSQPNVQTWMNNYMENTRTPFSFKSRGSPRLHGSYMQNLTEQLRNTPTSKTYTEDDRARSLRWLNRIQQNYDYRTISPDRRFSSQLTRPTDKLRRYGELLNRY
jgi:hypothetical protein